MIIEQTFLDICAGGGGFSLAASQFDRFKTVAFCENDSHAQEVLQKNFPNIPIINDIADVSTATLRRFGISSVAGLTAGFPCTPHSQAGKKRASKDDRNLWPELARIIRDVQPQWCVFENVPGLLSSESGRFFESVLWDLASMGFNAEWGIVSCAEMGGTHLRERIWIIAYSSSNRLQTGIERSPIAGAANSQGWQKRSQSSEFSRSSIASAKLSQNQTRVTPYSQENRRGLRDCADGETGTATTFEFDSPGNSSSNRRKQQLPSTNEGGQEHFLGNGLQFQSRSESPIRSSDDGLSGDLGGYLLTPEELPTYWEVATIPLIERQVYLNSSEVKRLSPKDRAEYDALCAEYRRQYQASFDRLCDAEKSRITELKQQYQIERRSHRNQIERYGNAIVPQVATVVFQRLIEILEEV